MAKQFNLLGSGQIISTALHSEMERSYLEYAMSVIVGRALPDVRDGLKPVHRRILYAMHELGLTPDRPFRKCARVVGDVLGKYHPHGDQAVYDALVRMAQDFSTRYPLLDGHGNFGSVDNDPPAAMRYTETRLASVAHQAMLSEIGEATVDFTSNFDNSQQEPVVLPVQLPILLLNGCSGIAVGMATNIPPHNLSEVVDGLIALIDKPDLPDQQLWQLIPGPDFPTGGEIIDNSGIIEAYRTGKGIITVRGVAKVENISVSTKRRKERTALIVTELPYQVNKASWIEKVAELVNQGKIEGIADIRDESNRAGIRVVIELKRDTNPQPVLKQLYRQTALQSNFGAIMLALVENKPCQLPLRDLLTEFLNFREQTLRRQYSHDLEQAQQRLHLVGGLLSALNNLDRVIDILRNAADGTTAKYTLETELNLTDAQTDSILAMPMRRLTGLEKQKLETEFADLQQRIAELERILRDRNELMKSLKKEFRALKRKYGDQRRTRIVIPVKKEQPKQELKDTQGVKEKQKQVLISNEANGSGTKIEKEAKFSDSSNKQKKIEIQPSVFNIEREPNATIAITHQGCIYWQNPTQEQELLPSKPKPGEDFVVQTELINDREQVIVITDSGKAYPLNIEEIPAKIQAQNVTALNLLSKAAQRDASSTVAHFFLPTEDKNLDLILLTEKGMIKRLPVSELTNLGNRGLVLIKLKEQDRLKYVGFTKEDQEVAIATTGGRILRLPVNDQQIPILGRNAQGNQALKLRYGEAIVGCVTLRSEDKLLLVTQSGYGKCIPATALRLASRGDIGTQAIQFSSKTDNLAGMILAQPNQSIMVTTNNEQKLVIAINQVNLLGTDGAGNKLVKLQSQEIVTELTRLNLDQ
ncbi:DNA topoisomerase (ATP-hydrolyzing) [Stanieria cyanosphaera PCC 7437]|uniref:DNA topoisomerase (ATP-hydrolyzing) n=1 Tax=Stanieria cyanosphaera (strain ATCC 29371 / PCC 7437) TaxID=111780 RepID=K9XQ85_STAC7|nr:DNA topoisomerase (ATP-hydrolyzing) [Stanieria cyanosphaera]AFZ34211.1 DNA topoisomerase (ATP-hydrolyzing) [Stanieria cyanosphaera PCC 7437]